MKHYFFIVLFFVLYSFSNMLYAQKPNDGCVDVILRDNIHIYVLPVAGNSCRFSIGRTTKTSSSPCRPQGAAVAETASAKTRVGEKLAETEEDLLRHRTDGTDAFDTLYIGCAKFPQNSNFRLNFTGVV